MAFFQDIAEKFGQLGALAKQTYKSAVAKRTARETEAKLQERLSPKPVLPTPQVPQLFKDVASQQQQTYQGIGTAIRAGAQRIDESPARLPQFLEAPISAVKSGIEASKEAPKKLLNHPAVAPVLVEVAKRTSGTGIVSSLEAIGPKTFEEAYAANRKAQAGDPSKLNQFLYQLGDSLPQTALGVALNFVPVAGRPLSAAYWTALSSAEQLESKGEVTSLGNIGIDVVGDRILGNSIQALFKTPAKSFAKTVLKNFNIEGGTEVAQDLLKMQNDYLHAKTEDEKNQILAAAKNYFTSGQILMTYGVGGAAGAAIGGAAYASQEYSKLSPEQKRAGFVDPSEFINNKKENLFGDLTPEPARKEDEPEQSSFFGDLAKPETSPTKNQSLLQEANKFNVLDKNKKVIGEVSAKDFYYAEDKAKELFGDKYSSLMKKPQIKIADDLLQEAKKYKSAEEFVKAQPTVYHGTNNPKLEFKDAVKSNYADERMATFSSSDRQVSEMFGKNIHELTPNLKNPLVVDAKKNNYYNIPVPKELKKDVYPGMKTIDTDSLVEIAQERGHDGVIIKNVIEGAGEFDPSDARDLIVGLKKDSFLTKSQLTEIWNQANKQEQKIALPKASKAEKVPAVEEPLIAEARKYKTADEFVNAKGTPVYRGEIELNKGIRNAEWGIPVTTKKEIAAGFKMDANGILPGKKSTISELYINKDARIATKKDIPQKLIDEYNDINPGGAANPPSFEDEASVELLYNWAKKNGFDGVDMSAISRVGLEEGEVKIFNNKVLNKKSQLTDIWEKANKSQKQVVKETLAKGPKTIKEVAEATNILEPNVRRILGVGAKEGVFERVDKGVYVLKDSAGKETAWIEAGDAVDVLPRMVSEGRKFDSIILDPAYFSRALIGGNRGIKAYEFIMPDEFRKVMNSVADLVKEDSSHVYLMLSGARTAQADMLKYAEAATDAGFKVVGEGGYQKTFKDGSPVTNVRGEVAQPERIILMTKSGIAKEGEIPVNLTFRFVRPSIKTSYATEKPKELIEALIRQSTLEGESVLDPFAGSGVTGAEALKAGRKPTLVEKRTEVVEEVIKPRLTQAIYNQKTAEAAKATLPAKTEKPALPTAQLQPSEATISPELKLENKIVSFDDTITQALASPQEAKEAFYKFDREEAPAQTPATTEDPTQLKDIAGFTGQARDVFRNFEHVYGKQFPKIKKELLDPFDDAKGRFVDVQKQLTDELYSEIVQKLKIKADSKESAAVMDYGEKVKTLDEITKEFGAKRANDIVEADRWFRQKYDKLLDEVNKVRAEIYPNSPEKQIPKRQDYYRHYKELGTDSEQLKTLFETPSGISPSLSGVSPFTKPKSKFLSFAQKRLGNLSKRDAVGGFLEYVPAYSYAKEIDPFIGRFRGLATKLAEATEDTKNVNNFIEFLQDFSNDLSGKTNPADRYAQKIVGRTAFRVVNWLNRRVKANTVLGNLSSSISQIFNIPQGIGLSKQYAVPGAVKTFGGLFETNPEMAKSSFIKERYMHSMYDKFETGMMKDVKGFAVWLTGVLDEVGTKFTWNSLYLKGKSAGVSDPIKYADDLTRKMVAGRGVGEVPLIQKSKLFQIVAPFQLEVGNAWWVMKDMVNEKQFGALVVMFIVGWLMNRVAEKIKGNDVVFDPIQAAYEGAISFSEEDNKWLGLEKFLGRIGGEVLSNVPGGQTLASMAPETLPDWIGGLTKKELFGKGDPTRYGSGLLATKAISDPLFKLLPSYGGGQLEKTYKGIKAYTEGKVESASGKTKLFDVAKGEVNLAKTALFGPFAAQEAKEYLQPSKEARELTALNKKEAELASQFKSAAEDKVSELAKMSTEERKQELLRLAKENPEMFKKILAIIKDAARGLTKEDRQVLSLGVENGFRAKYIVEKIKSLPAEERKAFIADYVSKKIITKEVLEQILKLAK